MADKKISQLALATTPVIGTEVLPIVQSGSTKRVSIDNLTKGRTVNATAFDTDIAAAGVTLSGTTLAADGTDTNIDINITPKGAGEVNISKVDIDGGAIDGTTVGASSASTGKFTQVDVDNIRVDGNTISNTDANGDLIIDPQRALLVDVTTRQQNSIAQVRDLVFVPTNNGDFFQQFDIAKGTIDGIVDANAFNLFTASTLLAYGFPQGCAFAGQLFIALHYMDNQGGQRSHQVIYDIGLGATNNGNLTWQFDQVRDYYIQNGGGTPGTVALSAVNVSTTAATLAITVTGGTYPVNTGGPNQITARLIGTATSYNEPRKLSIVSA